MPWPHNPRPAKSLVVLLAQINQSHPSRSRVSDGLLGDPRHQAAGNKSDHNPWVKVSGVGVVTAVDITHDPANGVHGLALAQALIDDSRVKYVIFAGRIWKARTGQWEDYRGANRHDKHVHVSVKQENADDESPWVLNGEKPARRTLRFGDSGPDVADLQRKLSIKADGKFGNHTLFAVREYQLANGLEGDGIAGPKTLALLYD